MPLNDDPALLHRPIGFAVGINTAEDLDVDAARRRLPGLLRFARTFIAEVLDAQGEDLRAAHPAQGGEEEDRRVLWRAGRAHQGPDLLDRVDLEVAGALDLGALEAVERIDVYLEACRASLNTPESTARR